MAVFASSSNFRHYPKAAVQVFRAAEMALASSEALHILAFVTMAARSVLVQQVQASVAVVLNPPTDLLRQAIAPALNWVTRSSHIMMKVMLGWGMLEGSQALWMSSLKESRVEVRLASCLAPSLVVLPPQDGADLLPDLFPAVVFCFSILFFCFSKLEMTSFHIFMIVIDCSKQAEEIVAVCLELLLLFILFFFLLDP